LEAVVNKSLQFEVRKRLETGDLGEDYGDGFRMVELGGEPKEDRGSPLLAPPVSKIKPKTRAERIKYAEGMAAQLMDWYMLPEVMNDNTILNPIRDGIPQCTAHPFVSGSATQIGCIWGCGAKERDGAGNLPVAKDNTLGDTWHWVKALVAMAVLTQDKRLGNTLVPDLTPGR
jgi:hypothetical protein